MLPPNDCRRCALENPAHGRFCHRCGAPLGSPCCGFANPSGARFCGGCGRALEVGGAVEPPAADVADLEEVLAEASFEHGLREELDSRPVHLDQSQLDRLFDDFSEEVS